MKGHVLSYLSQANVKKIILPVIITKNKTGDTEMKEILSLTK